MPPPGQRKEEATSANEEILDQEGEPTKPQFAELNPKMNKITSVVYKFEN